MRFGLLVVFMTIGGVVFAQNRKINLENANWEKVIEKAGKEEKLIFVDCNAEWCNPCKALVKNVFSRDAVADFYNEHFVCVSYDVDKDAVPEFVNMPKTKAVPLLLFVDPKTRTVVHARLGGLDEAGMLRLGQTALDEKWNLAGMHERFQQGERSEILILPYLDVLKNLRLHEERTEILNGYFGRMTVERLLIPGNWNLFEEEVHDPFVPVYRLAWEAQGVLADKMSEEQVKKKLDQVLLLSVKSGVERVDWGQVEENYRRLVDVRDYLVTLEWERRDFCLFVLNMADQIYQKNYDDVLKGLKLFLRKYGTEDEGVIEYVYIFCEKLKAHATSQQIIKGIGYVDQVVKGKEKGIRSHFLYLKRDMLKAAGQEKEAMRVDTLATKMLNPHFYDR